MKNVTAVIISFLRQEYTTECVRSLREMYPGIKILVAENGEYNRKLADFIHGQEGQYFLMPFDSGVCYARNRLMELVRTDFVLVGDDDFFYTKEASIDKIKKVMEQKGNEDMALMGGRVREQGVLKNYQGDIEIGDGFFHYTSLDLDRADYVHDPETGIQYEKVDITFNFFLARTELVRDIPWDEKIKVAYEHSDWFISLKKAGRKVFFCPQSIVVHKPEHIQIKDIGRYKVYRHRRSDKVHFFRKHGIKYSINFNGQKTTFDDSLETAKKVKRERGSATIEKAYTMDRSFSWNGTQYNSGEVIYTDRPIDGMRAVGVRVDNLQKARK